MSIGRISKDVINHFIPNKIDVNHILDGISLGYLKNHIVVVASSTIGAYYLAKKAYSIGQADNTAKKVALYAGAALLLSLAVYEVYSSIQEFHAEGLANFTKKREEAEKLLVEMHRDAQNQFSKVPEKAEKLLLEAKKLAQQCWADNEAYSKFINDHQKVNPDEWIWLAPKLHPSQYEKEVLRKGLDLHDKVTSCQWKKTVIQARDLPKVVSTVLNREIYQNPDLTKVLKGERIIPRSFEWTQALKGERIIPGNWELTEALKGERFIPHNPELTEVLKDCYSVPCPKSS